jgi:hypothetical protein
MTLAERLSEYVRACFTGIWIESHEHDDALSEIAGLCRREEWRLASWDIERGLQLGSQSGEPAMDAGGNDPLAALRALSALATPDGSALLVLANFHRLLNSAEIVQALARQIMAGKQNRTFVLVLSPVVQIPTELDKLFVVVEHDLPSRDQLEQIARGIATEPGELSDGDDLGRILDAAAGLTRYEAEGAFSLSLVRNGRVEPAAIWDLKTQTLKKGGLLALHRGQERFADLGGLQALKDFCLRAMRRHGRQEARTRPRGVLLLGVSGSGKSAFAKALGNETGRPTLLLDVGSLMGSLVGQTESQTRQALRIADAMAPCVLFLDEVEKGLAGATGQANDSGVWPKHSRASSAARRIWLWPKNGSIKRSLPRPGRTAPSRSRSKGSFAGSPRAWSCPRAKSDRWTSRLPATSSLRPWGMPWRTECLSLPRRLYCTRSPRRWARACRSSPGRSSAPKAKGSCAASFWPALPMATSARRSGTTCCTRRPSWGSLRRSC